MEKNIYKFSLVLLFIFVSLLFFIPSKVNVLSYKSDFVNLEDSVEFSTNEFTMDLEYTVFTNGTPEKPSAIRGYAVRKMDDMYYYHYIVYYYNSNKEEIGATDGYNGMWRKSYSQPTISTGSYISSFLEHSNMYDGYKLSDIKYYKLFIEPSTKDVVHNYLYNDNTKLNPHGLDTITDFNTVEMIATSLEEVNNNYSDDNYNNDYSNYNSNSEYTLNSYDINIIVNENNTLNITEKIGAYFNAEKHGIFRKIPLKNEITRLDGTTSKNRAKISDIKVSDNYSLSTENGYKVIKIGDANYTLTGQKNYEISYLYNLGRDTGKEYDELYFNLIGDEWDTSISNITFTITMPKEFDSSKLGFSSGAVGSIDSSKITYNVNGNIISGKYNGTLGSGDALTVRLELPEGYFVNAGINMSPIYYLMFIVPIVGLLISFILWKIYGKDEQVIETVEFYPPQGFNSLEIGFLYKGNAENKDVTSLLIYLANKGYIKITETEDKSLFSTGKGFIITKLKEYDGSNANEKMFLTGLFENNDSVDLAKAKEIMTQAKANGEKISYLQAMELATDKTEKQSVTIDDLYNSFYITMGKIISNINNKKNKELIFEKNTKMKSIAIILFIIATLVTIISIPTLEYAGVGELRMTLFICAFYTPFFAIGLFAKIPIGFRIFWLGFTLFHSFFFFSTLPLASAVKDDYHYLIGILFGIICVVGMVLLFKSMPKRTKYGNEMLGKIKGFKKFLETAEKQKLEAMVMENPTYFYDILPFTYVLGVSDKWIKKFETISLQAPNWYDGYSSFNTASFGSFVNSTMMLASSAMSSSPSNSSGGGGGSSGGGSSGGGSGGGGGGSW